MSDENNDEGAILGLALELLAEANAAEPAAATGACLVAVGGSPRPKCFQLTPLQCSAIKGNYIGGPCPL